MFFEFLERRELLAADYLYSLEARPGVPKTGFGFSQTANSQYHVVANFADYVSPLFPENYPGSYPSRFYGELQVHDATSGNLIRTIQNPLPYGHPDFSNYYGFNNSWITPNAFGYSLDLHDNLLLVGSPGWDGQFVKDAVDGSDRDTGGRAFLFDITTGNLLHTFDGLNEPQFSLNNDGFGRSVAIDGNYIVISSYGPSYDDPELQIRDDNPGQVYVYSTVTRNLLHVLESPNLNPPDTLDFGATVSLSDGKLTVTQGLAPLDSLGPTLIYDAATGNLLHTLAVNGERAIIDGNDIAVASANTTVMAKATSGSIAQTISKPFLNTDGNLIVSGTTGLNANFQLQILDFPTGTTLYSVTAPPNFVQANWEVNQVPQVFGNRLLVPGQQDTSAPKNVVFVYSVTASSGGNSPPTDLALTQTTVIENSANGTLVGILSATDADVPETFTYSLLNNAGGRFGLNGNQLIVTNGSNIDYEANPQLQVRVKVVDSAGNSYDEPFLISVTNVDEAITGLALYDRKVVEQSPNGTLVAAIDNPAPTPLDDFGKVAATSSRVLVTSDRTPQAYLLDAGTMEIVHVLQTSWQQLNFSSSLSISNSYAAIGNPSDSTQGIGSGAVDIFDIGTGTRLQTLYAPTASSAFGISVSLFGDRVAVSSLAGQGRVSVYQLSTGNLLFSVDSPLASNNLFGSSLALTAEQLLVGQCSGAGFAHVYSAINGAYLYTINNPAPSDGDCFGQEIRVQGNRILIGAPYDDTQAENAGAAYLFEAATGTLLHTFLPTAVPIGTQAEGFGQSLDLNSSIGRIAIGSSGSTSAKLYDAVTFAQVQELPGVHLNSEVFGEYLAFSGNRLVVGDRASRGAFSSGELQVFNAITGQLQPGLRVLPDDAGDTYTLELLDSAGGRFALQGNQLIVANGAAIDFESSTSYSVTVRATDAAGSTHTQVLTIEVIDANESLTDATLDNNSVQEPSVRWLHSPRSDSQRFGEVVSANGETILVTESVGNQKTVHAIHAVTGQHLQSFFSPFSNPNADQPEGDFGSSTAVVGNLAYIGASATKIGNLERAGAVYVFDITTGLQLFTIFSPTPAADGYFGSTLAASGDVLAVSAPNESGGKVYLFHAATGQLWETIVNPTPAPLEAFGQSMTISGNTIVTSSRFENAGAGVAYIYRFNQATSVATLIHTLSSPSPAANEFFGASVAVADNLVAVKDSAAVGSTENVGSVHLFHRVTGDFLRTIENPSPGANDQFGNELHISGQLVIASSASDIGGFNNGRVYVFRANTGELVTTISNPSAAAGDEFGLQLAIAGKQLIATAKFDDTDSINRGLAYVFELPGRTVGTFSANDPDVNETFSYSLLDDAGGRFAIQGNQLVVADPTLLDHEQVTQHNVTVAINDSGGNQIFRTYSLNVTAINEPPLDTQISNNSFARGYNRSLHHPNIAKGFGIGYSTATEGNLVVTGTNNLSNEVGEVYVMNAATGQLVTKLASPAPELNEVFGEKVAIANNRVIVTARLKDIGSVVNAGVAYVFDATTGGVLHTLSMPAPLANSMFGTDAAADGNLIAIASTNRVFLFNAVTGNLLTMIPISGLVRSLAVDNNSIVISVVNGDVQVYDYNPSTLSAPLALSLPNPSFSIGDGYGAAVKVNGNTIAVSARLYSQPVTNAGRVYLFDRNTGALLHSLSEPLAAANNEFGGNLALENNLLAVAAPFEDTGATDAGTVYTYDVVSGNLLNIIHNPAPNIGDFFSRVSLANGRLIVGSGTDDTDGIDAGMVYVFELDGGKTLTNLATTDPDPGDAISYTLLDSTGGPFKLQGNSIVVADGFLLNAPVYQLPIRATDSAGLSTTENLAIQVDGPQPPTGITFAGNVVVENASNSTVVSTLSTQDPNPGDTFTYSLTDNAGGRFVIVGNTIRVNNGSNLDFEASPSHVIIVTVTDSSGLSTYESFVINLTDVVESFDFGDLPDSFATQLASDGARHMLNNGLKLGAIVTGETNGQPSAAANLDIGDDGVALPPFLVPGLNATFVATASQTGRLDAFIDFDSNGQFSSTERVTPAQGLLVAPGANTFTISVPANVTAENRAIRFRISSAGGLLAIGPASDGEVEDYKINTIIPVPLSSQVVVDPEFPEALMLLVNGSAGNDTIVVNANVNGARATINGVPGSLTTLASRITIFGQSGNDDIRINGSSLRGFIDGGNGNDTIRGGNGNDVLMGSAGNDLIFGRSGNDTIYGGGGNDILLGNGGVDTILGQSGNDYLTGHGILVGGSGIDDLSGVSSRNLIIGGMGADVLRAGNSSQGDLFVTGPTVHDENLVALAAIRAEWSADSPTAQRKAHIDGSLPDGLNSSFLLNASSVIFESNPDVVANLGSTNPLRTDWVIRSPLDRRLRAVGFVTIIDNSNANGEAPPNGEDEPDSPATIPSPINFIPLLADVNEDALVTALDALLVINQLNLAESGHRSDFGIDPEQTSLDVNGDGSVTPLDALLVINQLNSKAPLPEPPADNEPGDGEGEGEGGSLELAIDWVMEAWPDSRKRTQSAARST